MSNLARFVAQENFVRRLFSQPLYDADNLRPEEVRELLDSIEGALSPENLSCDGELSPSKVRVRLRMLTGAKAELERLTAC